MWWVGLSKSHLVSNPILYQMRDPNFMVLLIFLAIQTCLSFLVLLCRIPPSFYAGGGGNLNMTTPSPKIVSKTLLVPSVTKYPYH